jgi:hypothetical protein
MRMTYIGFKQLGHDLKEHYEHEQTGGHLIYIRLYEYCLLVTFSRNRSSMMSKKDC